MTPLAPPPPSLDPQLDRWMRLMWAKIQGALSSTWALMDFTGSNLTDIATRNHNDLQTLQGGTAGEYYHMTSAEHAALGTGMSYPTFRKSVSTGTTATIPDDAEGYIYDHFQILGTGRLEILGSGRLRILA